MERGRHAGREVGGGRGAAQRRKQHAGEVQTGDGERGTGGAHVKHVLHVCDAGRVEAQRLVESLRILPSPRGSHEKGARCGPGSRRGCGAAAAAKAACTGGGPDWTRGRDTGGAHREHVAHVCDAGRVQAQWLVERICVLPSPRGSMERGRHAGREVGVGGGAAVAQAACRGRSRLETGGGARVGRTENM